MACLHQRQVAGVLWRKETGVKFSSGETEVRSSPKSKDGKESAAGFGGFVGLFCFNWSIITLQRHH